MVLIRKKNTISGRVETSRPPEAEDYMPDEGSALRSVSDQSRGTTADTRSFNDVRKHMHDGTNSERISVRDLVGFIPTVSAAPTWVPKMFYEQFAVYTNGATLRLYVYDITNRAWRYVALT